MADKLTAGAVLLIAIFATAEARQLLQGTTPQQQVLAQVICFADQAAASAQQFAGLTGGKTGLPSVLNNLVGTSNSIESTLERLSSLSRSLHEISNAFTVSMTYANQIMRMLPPSQGILIVPANSMAQLGIKPSAACTKAPPAPTLDIAVKNIFCSTTNIVKQLETALGLGLPAAQQTAIQYDIAQLSNSFSSIEAGLIEFLFNIKC